MRRLLIILFCLNASMVFSQLKDSIRVNGTKIQKPEIFSGGFIDIAQTGQMNASARLFKLYIGEPGKWQMPISIYSGVSSNSFNLNRQNEDVVLSFINPLSGIFNMSLDGNTRLAGAKEKLTTLRIHYQIALRFLNVYNFYLYKNTTFHNLIGDLGLTLTTGAWEKDRIQNLGIFWLNFRGIYSGSPSSIVKDFFEVPVANNMLGYSIGLGIEISQSLNTRAFYFHFITNNTIPVFAKPVFQVSFDYSLGQSG